MAVTTSPLSSGSVTEPQAAAEHFPLRRAEVLLMFAFWVLIALLTAANMLLDPRGRGAMLLMSGSPIVLAFATSGVWAMLTPLIFSLAGRFSFDRAHWVWNVLVLLVGGLVLAISVDIALGWLRTDILEMPRPRHWSAAPDAIGRVRRLWFMNELLLYAALLAAGFARDYFLRYRARREEAIRLQAHAAQLQAQLADARLAALRTQLDPHFLFNTLHAVSAMVESDPRGVRRMISRLSGLLRHTLERRDDVEITLEEELGLVVRYLEIMQIRFGDRLHVAVEVEPHIATALVPNLILQPLVENAIKHGVSKIEGRARIDLRAHRRGSILVIQVLDNGPGLKGDPFAAQGIGLGNTRARLAELYGKDASIELLPARAGGTIVEMRVPYRRRDPSAILHGQAKPERVIN